MRIAFLGLGDTGDSLVRNLLGLGHTITVCSRTRSKVDALVGLGAREAPSVVEAVKDAEIAITMLSNDAAVKTLVFGAGGLLRSLPPRAIHLCMSDLEVRTSADLAVAHAQAGQGYVAAPILGKAGTILTREIWIIAGGPEALVNLCFPIFVALGHGLTRVGSSAALAHAVKQGASQLAKTLDKIIAETTESCRQAKLEPEDYAKLSDTKSSKSLLVDALGGFKAHADPVSLLSSTPECCSPASLPEPTIETRAEGKPLRWRPGTQRRSLVHPVLFKTRPRMRSSGVPMAPPAQLDISQPGAMAPPNFLVRHPLEFLQTTIQAIDGEASVGLEIDQISHFEKSRGHIWAWSQGTRYCTTWKRLDDVSRTFDQILFLFIKRDILLRPEAALDLRPTFGGRAKVRVAGGIELRIDRPAAQRLREIMGW